MSLPSFGDLYEKLEDLFEGDYFDGRYLFKSATKSQESGVTWKAKIHDQGDNNFLGKLAFVFEGEIQDVLHCNLKSSARTDGRIRSKVSFGDLPILPNAEVSVSAVVNTNGPSSDDNIELSGTYTAPYYTLNSNVTFPSSAGGQESGEGSERQIQFDLVAGLNGIMAGCNAVVGGEHSYALAYHPEGDWGVTALAQYEDDAMTEVKFGYFHDICEGVTLGGEYRKTLGGNEDDSIVSLGIKKECEKSGIIVKGKA
eukprot:PhF_6_TR16942/c0_g1_i3/m.25530